MLPALINNCHPTGFQTNNQGVNLSDQDNVTALAQGQNRHILLPGPGTRLQQLFITVYMDQSCRTGPQGKGIIVAQRLTVLVWHGCQIATTGARGRQRGNCTSA